MNDFEYLSPRVGKSYDKNGNEIQVEVGTDKVAEAYRIIRSDHSYIHEGKAYSISLEDINLANDAEVYMSFITGANKYAHLKHIISVDTKIYVYENPDAIDNTGATEKTPVNQNRLSTQTSEITSYYDVSPTLTNADLIKVFQGQEILDTWEMVLAQDTEYIIRIENIAGGTK